MNKNQLIQVLRDEQVAWNGLLAEVGETRMTSPNAVGAWSIKDIVAHLTTWEQRAVAWLVAAQRREKPERPVWPNGLSEDEENAFIYSANRDRSLEDVLTESRRVQEQLLAHIKAISEEDLNDAKRFDWLNGNSIADSTPGNSYEHYQDHAKAIREWLKLVKDQ